MNIEEIKNLIIKLDVTIDAEHEKTNANALMLLFDFTEKVRKKSILDALDYLSQLRKESAIREKMIELLLKDNIEQEQALIENGIVEGGILSDEGYEITLKEYRKCVETLARKELEEKTNNDKN